MSSDVQARHYNRLAQYTVTAQERRKLRTFPVRDFNNALKRSLITEMKKYVQPGCRILDMCCGRGGDIFKYKDLQPSHVHFVDISSGSVAEAKRRYNKGAAEGALHFTAQFSIADCFSSQDDPVLKDSKPFDLVFCHFALHYGFSHSNRLHGFLSTITAHMKPGAYFVSTFPSYNAIRNRALDRQGKVWRSFSNSVMSVRIQNIIDNESAQFGKEYLFSLEDAVDDCPEYLVPPELLNKWLYSFNLRPLIDCNFVEAAAQFDIAHRLPTTHTQLGRDMFDVCTLYTCHVAVNDNGTALARTAAPDTPPFGKNYRGILQEFCQRQGFDLPVFFERFNIDGWIAQCSLDIGGTVHVATSCTCSTKKGAQQHAAEEMLVKINPAILPVKDADEPPIFLSLEAPDLIVHVDANVIAFVSLEMVQMYPSVLFILYSDPGTDYEHLHPFRRRELPHNVRLKCTPPVDGVAGAMIFFEIGRYSEKQPNTSQVIVSLSATICHVVPNVLCVASLDALSTALEEFGMK